MADSPAKRRRLSPVGTLTPSRIPKPASASRPSFASPTRASLSRYNPQLLDRPSSSGSGLESRARTNLQDIFAKALGERGPDSQQNAAASTQDSRGGPSTQDYGSIVADSQPNAASSPRRSPTKSIGGKLSAKPRRLSRSPIKKVERTPTRVPDVDPAAAILANFNPFKKKGLRRSPIPGQIEGSSQPEPRVDAENPFRKTGLRRSPVSSQPAALFEEPVTSELRRSPVSSQPVAPADEPFVPLGPSLRRSPLSSQPVAPVEQPVITRSSALVRSPVSSQPLATIEPAVFTPRSKLRRSPILSQPVEHIEQAVFTPRSKLRRSPLLSQPAAPVEQPVASPPSPVVSSYTSPKPTQRSVEVAEVVDEPLPAPQTLETDTLDDSILRHTKLDNIVDELLSSPAVRALELAEPPRHSTGLAKIVDRPMASTGSKTDKPPKPLPRNARRSEGRPVPAPVVDVSVKRARPQSAKASRNSYAELVRDFSPLPDDVPGPPETEESLDEPIVPRRPHEPARSVSAFGLTGALTQPEPELPPTPTQRGIADPVVTTPPTGIHDTPSKRARRNKSLSAKLKSSPLKPKDPPPPELVREEIENKEALLKPKSEPTKRRKSARFLIPVDPHAATKRVRDVLLAELQQLKADVALANQENERLHQLTSSNGKAREIVNQDELIAMLDRAAAPENLPPKPKPVSIFKSINAFLPFQPRRKPPPTQVSTKPLPSHLPIKLDDPLPYLQAFSALTYTSTITLLPRRPTSSHSSTPDTEQPLLQKHLITASHPSGLFTTRFAMTVDTSSLSIQSIDILRLNMNAEKELGTFIRARARDTGPLGKDITVICWAMSRWVELSIKRARFWCAVEHELGTSEARIAMFQRKRKRKRNAAVLLNDDEEETMKWSRKQILQHFGRSSMELSNEVVELRVEWKIGFDWTGEVESSVTAAARIPKIWQEADERSSFDKIPDTFGRLLKEKGQLGAVRAVVQLLMPEG